MTSHTPTPFTVLRVRVPCLKPGRESSYRPPNIFETQKGILGVPRNADPPSPTVEWMSMARRGELVDCPVFCASDLVGRVSPQTAKISLDYDYDYQTEPFSDLPSIPDSQKNLRNLFYVSMRPDELPSYHFWIRPGDPNPVAGCQHTDWNAGSQSLENQGNEDDNIDLFNEPSAESNPELQDAEPLTSSDGEATREKQERLLAQLNAKYQKIQAQKALEAVLPSSIIVKGSYESGAEADKIVETEQSSDLASQNPTTSGQQNTGAKKGSVDNDKPFQQGSVPAVITSPREGEHKNTPALIHCQRGGVYLKNFSYVAFIHLALYVVQKEDNDTEVGRGMRFVDVLRPQEQHSVAYAIASGRKATQVYVKDIKPFLGSKGHKFRIRSDAYGENSPWDNSRSRTIKLTRPNFGYCYVNAVGNWNCDTTSRDHKANSDVFEDALDFLCGLLEDPSEKLEKEDEERNRAGFQELTLRFLPEGDEMEVDRSSDRWISSELGQKLEAIANRTPIPNRSSGPILHQYSAEIFVYKTGEAFVDPFTRALSIEASEVPTIEERPIHEGDVVSDVGHNNEKRAQSEIEELRRQLKAAEEKAQKESQRANEMGAKYCKSQAIRWRLDDDVKKLRENEEQLKRDNKRLEADRNFQQERADCAENEAQDILDDRLKEREDWEQTLEQRGMTIQALEQKVSKLQAENDQLQRPVEQLPQVPVGPASDSATKSAKKLLYCMTCMKSVDKLDEEVRNTNPRARGTN